MKKFIKPFLILILNLFAVIVLFFILDYFVYLKYSTPKSLEAFGLTSKNPYKYYLKNINILYTGLDGYFDGGDNEFRGRLPVGLEYSSNPVIIFGDSYAHGQYLEYNQNFGYKLSKILKRPVYNRAVPGSGIQTMYFQVSKPFSDTFFAQVPKTDTVFYILIGQHYERLAVFSVFDPIGSDSFMLRYKNVNGKLVCDDYNNPFLNFLKSSYLVHVLNLKFVSHYIKNPKYKDKVADEFLAYFKQTRDVLEKEWNNKIKFNVILYDDVPVNCGIPNKEAIKKKLKENDFNVIDIDDLTDEDLNSEKYLMQDNLHPTEAAWDLLTPKIIEKSLL